MNRQPLAFVRDAAVRACGDSATRFRSGFRVRRQARRRSPSDSSAFHPAAAWPRRHPRRLDVAFAENVKDLFARSDEIVRNNPAMASPPDGLGAHHGRPRRMSGLAQDFRALSESPRSWRSRRNCESSRCPRRRWSRARRRAGSAQAAERSQMPIADLEFRQRGGKNVTIELRVGARARHGPHVDDEPDLRLPQQRRKRLGRARGMADGEERGCRHHPKIGA